MVWRVTVKICIHLLQGLSKNIISLWDNRVNFNFFTYHQFTFRLFEASPFIQTSDIYFKLVQISQTKSVHFIDGFEQKCARSDTPRSKSAFLTSSYFTSSSRSSDRRNDSYLGPVCSSQIQIFQLYFCIIYLNNKSLLPRIRMLSNNKDMK